MDLPQIRQVNVFAQPGGQDGVILVQTGIVDLAPEVSQRMEVIEDQRALFDPDALLAGRDAAVLDVPRRGVDPRMLEADRAGKLCGPSVEIFLVGVAVGFQEVETPYGAFVGPVRGAGHAGGVMTERNPADVIFAIPFEVGEGRRKAVRCDRNRGGTDLIIDGLQRAEEIEIGVEIGQQFAGGNSRQQVPHQPSSAGEIEFQFRAVGAGGSEGGIFCDQLRHGQQADLGQIFLPERGLYRLIHAQHHQLEIPGVDRQRPVQRQATG